MSGAGPLLAVRGLWVRVQRKKSAPVSLVLDATFDVGRGEIVCLVGESGSGKSVTAQALMGLVQRQPGITAGGEALLEGRDLLALDPEELRRLRGRELAMVFQEPMSYLDPIAKIGSQLGEAIQRRERLSPREQMARMSELLETVGISDQRRCLEQYPHQLSGGMCQRVMIAMALAARPSLLIADEPTTALDVTIQAQILSLLDELRRETGMSVLLITHNMGVAAEVADRVVVMYAGRVVEQGTPVETFRAPLHPYTVGLLRSIPSVTGPRLELLPAIPGGVPDPRGRPSGCAFHPRCPQMIDYCKVKSPPLAPVDGRPVACWRAAELLQQVETPRMEAEAG